MRSFVKINRIILLATVLVLFARNTAAQQWESFLSPPLPVSNNKLVEAGGRLFIFGWNGLYRSTDEGAHWTQIRSYTSDNVSQVLVFNRNTQKLYWSEGLDSMSFYRLLVSPDLGDTWQQAGNVQADISAFVGDTIFGPAYLGSGMDMAFRPGNGAWSVLPGWPSDTAGFIQDICARDHHLWAVAAKGIYRSQDAGLTWEFLRPLSNQPIFNDPVFIYRLFIEELNGNLVVANEKANKLYLSQDDGENWEEYPWLGKGLFNTGQHLFCSDSAGVTLMRFNETNPAAWTDMQVETNGDLRIGGIGETGETVWLGSSRVGVARKRTDFPRWEIRNGVFNSGGGSLRYQEGWLFLDDQLQTFSEDNGTTWQQNVREIYPDFQVSGNDNLAIATDQGTSVLLRCPRNGRFEWEIFSTLPDFVRGVSVIGDTLICQSSYVPYRLFESFDNGATWTNTITLPSVYGNANVRLWQKSLLVVKDKTVYRSEDLGVNWQAIYSFPNTIDESVGRFYVVKDTVLLSHPPLDLLFYSEDGGLNFDILPTPQNINTTAYRLRVRPGLLLLHLDEPSFYISRDMGSTWTTVGAPPGITQAQMAASISGDAWSYGDNTLFMPDNRRLRLDNQRRFSGRVFFDNNGNGQPDNGEDGIDNVVVQTSQSNILSTTYLGGYFSVLLGQQGEQASVTGLPPYFTISPPAYTVPNGGATIPFATFAVKPQSLVTDTRVKLATTTYFRAGYDNTIIVNVRNNGSLTASGLIRLLVDPLLNVTATTPAADYVSGDTLFWNYGNLKPFQELQVQVVVATAVVPPGTPAHISAEAVNNPDTNTADNIAVLDQQISSSYDPNDKSVSDEEIPVSRVSESELVYTVRFQNLGNISTDFITVRDTLSEALDVCSVRVLAASHPWELRLENNRVLVFRFNPVQLTPASRDSMGSQGFIQFAINLKPNLQTGDEITNTAHIYFDFNPAVVTNTVKTSIGVSTVFEPARHDLPLGIYPNPSTGNFTLVLPGDMEGAGRIEIFSGEGRVVHTVVTQSAQQEIILPPIPAGTYWCRWIVAGRTNWGKAVVNK